MEKRTLLAIVLSVIVISASFFIQSIFYPPQPVGEATLTEALQPVGSESTQRNALEKLAVPVGIPVAVTDDSLTHFEQNVTISTNKIKVVLSNYGGNITSFKLLEHKDKDDYVEMVLPGESESKAFTISFGDKNTQPVNDFFIIKRISDYIVEFSNTYTLQDGTAEDPIPFELIKRYEFKPDEYMFELSVTIDAGYARIPLNFNNYAYTLATGPQIGPSFAKLSNNYEYRRYYTYADGKRKTQKVSTKADTEIDGRVSWAAVAGKYFTLIAIPDATEYTINFSSKPENGINEVSKLIFSRPAISNSKNTDVYRFYMGPKTQKALGLYNSSDDNAFKLRDSNITAVVDTSGILAPLEFIMKWLLMIFYSVIPNYGVAIILLTIVVKGLMFPLTKKGSQSTLKMKALSPKIKDIQTKYKDNPNKMNMEMAELYKSEGYNPLSGCLPMLLQIPFFFAMYNLFNNHFDLRGAMFIPGWIPDLSIPESIWNFSPITIPILGWSNLRLLPFIYLFSQLMYAKVTQTPDQQSNSQMKIMLFAMPIMFFFILYDVPSGLLIYWILSNLLTLVQQVVINKFFINQAPMVEPVKQNVIAPSKSKRRR